MRKKIDIERIYQVALINFANSGYKKTTLDDIAKELGVTKGNLYLYTHNKQSLYHDSIRYALINWQTRVKSAIQNVENPKEQLLILCQKAFSYLAENKIFCEILKNDPEIFPFFSENDRFKEINNESIAMIKSIIQNGVEQKQFIDVDAEKISQVFFSIYKMFIIQAYVKNESSDVLSVFLQTLDLITTGLFIPDQNNIGGTDGRNV
jgi:AcrR family transcriptional regulator